MALEPVFSPEISNGVKLERHFAAKERVLVEYNPGLRQGEQSDQDYDKTGRNRHT